MPPHSLAWPPPEEALKDLRTLLDDGGVLAIPTESSYALAADPGNAEGVARVFALKGRGWHKPLPVAVGSMRQLGVLGVRVPAEAGEVLAAIWPARLTAVLPLVEPSPTESTFRWPVPAAAGGSTLAVRIPEHPELCRLLEVMGPLTVTSANRSDQAPALTAGEAKRVLTGEKTVLLDAGDLPGGPPSTLVLWRGGGLGEMGAWDVLRPGPFDPRRLAPPGG